MISILDWLASDNYVAYNKKLAHLIWINETIFLMDLISKYKYFLKRQSEEPNRIWIDKDWYFYNTIENIYNDTALTKKQQAKCCDNLQELGILQTQLKWMPAKKYFKIDEKKLEELLSKPKNEVKNEAEQSSGETGENWIDNNDLNSVSIGDEVVENQEVTKGNLKEEPKVTSSSNYSADQEVTLGNANNSKNYLDNNLNEWEKQNDDFSKNAHTHTKNFSLNQEFLNFWNEVLDKKDFLTKESAKFITENGLNIDDFMERVNNFKFLWDAIKEKGLEKYIFLNFDAINLNNFLLTYYNYFYWNIEKIISWILKFEDKSEVRKIVNLISEQPKNTSLTNGYQEVKQDQDEVEYKEYVKTTVLNYFNSMTDLEKKELFDKYKNTFDSNSMTYITLMKISDPDKLVWIQFYKWFEKYLLNWELKDKIVTFELWKINKSDLNL